MRGHGPDIAWFRDPAGNILSVLKLDRDADGPPPAAPQAARGQPRRARARRRDRRRAAARRSSARTPRVDGWILDERGVMRRHINVFVNGERGAQETHVQAEDRIDVLPAISGGCTHDRAAGRDEEGPVRARGRARARGFEVTARAFAGEPVEYALRDPRSGRVLAAVELAVLRPEGLPAPTTRGGEWEQADGDRAPRGRRAGARAAVDPQARRGRRPDLRRRRSRRAVREPRRRRDVRAQPRAVGAPDAAEVAAGRRRAVPALDRDVARRARTGSRSRSPRPACG